MKTGLIMEGGAMRGLFTAGVIDVFMENGVEFDGAIGVSAGAAFGCNYKSRQIGRAIRYNKKYCKDERYCGIRTLIKTGDMYGADFCYREIPDVLDPVDRKTFDENPLEFYAVCTDVTTGKAVYKKCDKYDFECSEWIRASASMPLVSKIVHIGGLGLLDGGIADSIPIRYFESIGYQKNVVILTRPYGYIKRKNSLMPFLRIVLKKYPNVIKAISERHNVYNETLRYIAEKEHKGEICVIRPKQALCIGKIEHDPNKMQSVYDLGRQTAEEYLPKVKSFAGISASC